MNHSKNLTIIYTIAVILISVIFTVFSFLINTVSPDLFVGLRLFVLGIIGLILLFHDKERNMGITIINYYLFLRLLVNMIFSYGLDVYHVYDTNAELILGFATILIFINVSYVWWKRSDTTLHIIPINFMVALGLLSTYWHLSSGIVSVGGTLFMIIAILYGKKHGRNTIWLTMIGILFSLSITISFGADPVGFLFSILLSVLAVFSVIAATIKKKS